MGGGQKGIITIITHFEFSSVPPPPPLLPLSATPTRDVGRAMWSDWWKELVEGAWLRGSQALH